MTYLEKVKEWLDTPPAERDLEKGATLMLKSNRNQILYRNVIKRSNFDKIEYELRKVVANAKDGDCNEDTVQKMQVQVDEIVKNLPAEDAEPTKGKREDHDTLPEEIQALYTRNGEIYPLMRVTHARLLAMGDKGTACDRQPYLKYLIDLENELLANWKKYDEFVPGSNTGGNPPAPIVIDAKRISANRKYLSDNKKKLQGFITAGNKEKANELRAKMLERYNELVTAEQGIDEEQIKELVLLGVLMPAEETAEESSEDNAEETTENKVVEENSEDASEESSAEENPTETTGEKSEDETEEASKEVLTEESPEGNSTDKTPNENSNE